MSLLRPIVWKDGVYQPMPNEDQIDPATVARSTWPGNNLRVADNGLYAGKSSRFATYYVDASAGSDVAGTQVYQSLNFALSQLIAMSTQYPSGGPNQITVDAVIAIRAGQGHGVYARYSVHSNLTFAFYGDPNFGDYNGPLISTTADPACMDALQRPSILPQPAYQGGEWTIAGFDVFGNGHIQHRGVRVELPNRPSPAPSLAEYGWRSDYVHIGPYSNGQVSIVGTIVNKQDANSLYGFIGVNPRAAAPAFSEFASQFRIADRRLDEVAPSSDATLLGSRPYFIKMHNDYAGNNQARGFAFGDSSNSSPGASVLRMNWSETPAQLVGGGYYNMPTSPPLFNVTYGMRNWIFNLSRDQQARPLNVSSGKLF